MMLVVGVTGGLGAGKSTVATMLEELGAEVINADRLAHLFLRKDTIQHQALVEEFGEGILGEDGAIDRRLLGERAFATEQSVRVLNGIIHPALLEEIRKAVSHFRRHEKGILVVDAALLLDWNLDDLFDVIVNVEVDTETGLGRAGNRMHQSPETLQKRMNYQISAKERRRRSNVTIRNDSSIEDLRKQVGAMWSEWKERSKESEA